MEEVWTLVLGAEVTLLRPGGDIVKSLPQKALAALAVLGLLHPEPVSRRRMGEILWPISSIAQRQVSLRQMLATVRRELNDAAFLVTSRSGLALDASFIKISILSSGAMFTQFTDPWFVLLRSSESAARQAALRGDPSEEESEAVRSLTNLLNWTVQHQAENALGLIYHAVDLATSIPGQQALSIAEELLRRSSPSHPMRGWGSFFKAIALFYTNETESARDEFHRVRLAAASRGNGELMVISAFHEAGAILPMGDLEGAQRVLDECRSSRLSRSWPRAAIRLEHGLGLVAACKGDYRSALPRLQRAAEAAQARGEQYEQAYAAVNCAWIAASIGEQEIGHAELERFEAADTGASYRFDITSQLARIHLHCGEGKPLAGIAVGEATLARTQTLHLYGFETYVRESLARCYTMIGDKDRAIEEVRAASECRSKVGWVVIPWDEDRLSVALTGRPR